MVRRTTCHPSQFARRTKGLAVSNCGSNLRPTPPHPTPAFPFNVMAFPINVMAFPIHVMAFPFNGMAPGLAVWGLRATFLAPSATWSWPGSAARPGAIPLIGNAITLIGNAITLIGNAITNIKWKRRGGVGWGRGGFELNLRTSGRGSNRRPP